MSPMVPQNQSPRPSTAIFLSLVVHAPSMAAVSGPLCHRWSHTCVRMYTFPLGGEHYCGKSIEMQGAGTMHSSCWIFIFLRFRENVKKSHHIHMALACHWLDCLVNKEYLYQLCSQ